MCMSALPSFSFTISRWMMHFENSCISDIIALEGLKYQLPPMIILEACALLVITALLDLPVLYHAHLELILCRVELQNVTSALLANTVCQEWSPTCALEVSGHKFYTVIILQCPLWLLVIVQSIKSYTNCLCRFLLSPRDGSRLDGLPSWDVQPRAGPKKCCWLQIVRRWQVLQFP